MNISVEYKDIEGKIESRSYKMTRLAFAKHFAIAGQKYLPTPQKFLRAIGMFFLYRQYLQRQSFNNNNFSLPPDKFYDPTEKGQFSNLAGKAIADFLSKQIDRSLYTVNYETGMRLKNIPISGQRPDLLAYTKDKVFAIEAKGYSRSSPGNMKKHKEQSKTGGIPVNFTVACVSYNLYNGIQCKYYDPYNDNIPYDTDGLKELTKNYYSGLYGFLDKNYFKYDREKINGEDFYVVKPKFKKLFGNESYYPYYHLFEPAYFSRIQLILPSNIKELAEKGMSKNYEALNFELSNLNIRNIT